MTPDPRRAWEALPPVLRELTEDVRARGGRSLLVGGAVRDLLLTGSLPPDLDLEVRPPGGDLPALRDRLAAALPGWRTARLPFDVLRMEGDGLSLEWTPPRRETYRGPGPFAHDGFESTVDLDMTDAESFARRDLTVNAIALEPGGGRCRLVDPLGGLGDLARRRARPCSPDHFFLDPVRLFRLVRFTLQAGLSPDPALEADLGRFDLLRAAPRHALKEALRVPFFRWFRLLFRTARERGIRLGGGLSRVRFLGDVESGASFPDAGAVLAALPGLGLPPERAEAFRRFAGEPARTGPR